MVAPQLARMAKGIGMKVRAFDPYIAPTRAAELGVELTQSLEELLPWADVVSLHVPLTDSTRAIMNTAVLARMKPGSILINCARGELVDEQALLAVLQSGHLAGAGLDVFHHEPPPPDRHFSSLLRDDVVATPHVAAATVAGKRRLWKTAIEQAVAVCRGSARHLVNLTT